MVGIIRGTPQLNLRRGPAEIFRTQLPRSLVWSGVSTGPRVKIHQFMSAISDARELALASAAAVVAAPCRSVHAHTRLCMHNRNLRLRSAVGEPPVAGAAAG